MGRGRGWFGVGRGIGIEGHWLWCGCEDAVRKIVEKRRGMCWECFTGDVEDGV